MVSFPYDPLLISPVQVCQNEITLKAAHCRPHISLQPSCLINFQALILNKLKIDCSLKNKPAVLKIRLRFNFGLFKPRFIFLELGPGPFKLVLQIFITGPQFFFFFNILLFQKLFHYSHRCSNAHTKLSFLLEWPNAK